MADAYELQNLEALCFLYLTFSHATDDELTRDEMNTIAKTLREWSHTATLEEIGQILRNTVSAYKAIPSKADRYRKASEYAGELKENVSYDNLHKVVTHLTAIANANGKLVESERKFIIATANTLGVPPPASLLNS